MTVAAQFMHRRFDAYVLKPMFWQGFLALIRFASALLRRTFWYHFYFFFIVLRLQLNTVLRLERTFSILTALRLKQLHP